jgi:hypothetical protein
MVHIYFVFACVITFDILILFVLLIIQCVFYEQHMLVVCIMERCMWSEGIQIPIPLIILN